MRSFRLRITVRGLMIAMVVLAAASGLIISAMRGGRLAAEYRARAGWYATIENGNRSSMVSLKQEQAGAQARGDETEAERLSFFVELNRVETDWFARKRRLYEAAASRPWLPLPAELQGTAFPHLRPNPRARR